MRTLTTKMSLFALLIERVYTQKWLDAHPLTKALADDFAKFHERWTAVLWKYIELAEAEAAADALVTVADEDLDAMHVAIINTLKTLVTNNQGKELYASFTKNQRPSDQRKPTLGEQLTEMSVWVGSLIKAPFASLNDHGTALEPVVKQGADATDKRQSAERDMLDFEVTGELRQFVDEFNALRKTTQGKVEEIRILNKLPDDFSERCFLREARVRPPTRKSVLAAIERLEADLKRQKDILADMDAKEQAAAKVQEEADTAAAQDELAELDAQEKSLAKRRAEIQAKLAKPPAGET